jgi:hypothetical protein
VLRVVLMQQRPSGPPRPAEPLGQVLGHQPAVHEHGIGNPVSHEAVNGHGQGRAPAPLDADRHSPRVAREEAADRPWAIQGDANGRPIPPLAWPEQAGHVDLVPALQVREQRLDLIIPPSRILRRGQGQDASRLERSVSARKGTPGRPRDPA